MEIVHYAYNNQWDKVVELAGSGADVNARHAVSGYSALHSTFAVSESAGVPGTVPSTAPRCTETLR